MPFMPQLSIYNILILLFTGLMMSPLATYFFQQVCHIPLVLPELFYIPILFKYRYWRLSFNKNISFKYPLLWTIIFFIFALVNNEFNPIYVASTARSFLILFCFFVIGKGVKIDKTLLSIVMLISFGSVIGWCMSNYLNIHSYRYLLGNGILYGNMLAIPLAFSLFVMYNRNLILIFVLLSANIYLSVTTSLRRQIVISLISLGLSFILANLNRLNIKIIITTIVIVLSVLTIFPFITGYIEENNPVMYRLVVQRSERTLNGDITEGDEIRTSNIYKFLTDVDDLFFPHGFVSSQTTIDSRGIFVDTPTYMLSYTFGYIPFLFYLIIYIYKLCKCFYRSVFKKSVVYSFVFLVSSITLFLHFVDASMFFFSFTVPMTGFILGLLFRNDMLNEVEF